MKIKFCGAATGVTGSCHLLTFGEHKVLLDCGQFQGSKAEDALNYDDFPFDPTELDCMILSHAHIDHCGRIPLLIKRGFKGRIYCTDATADLVEVMLKDSGYIHEKEAEWQNKKNERQDRPLVEPLYTFNDAVDSLKYFEPVLYDQLITVNEDLKICFNDAGHILGSAITELWVTENDTVSKIVFSGDLGMKDRPILRDPKIIKKADYVIMETTYGNRLHPEHVAGVENLVEIIAETVERGGVIVIPSFAVGRTQELIYELNKYYEDPNCEYKEILDDLDVFIDSPMATTATEVFRKNVQVFDEETQADILAGDDPLDFKNLKFTRTSDESKALNLDRTPKVIISASGMCEAGRIRHHLKHNLWDPKSSIVFVGYQAEGTLGRNLLEGLKEVTLFGEQVHVNAHIYNLEAFSGHADQAGLLDWISGFKVKPPKQVFLVHGELDSKEDFAALVNEKLGYEPVVVREVSEFDLETANMVSKQEATYEVADVEAIENLRRRMADVQADLQKVLYNSSSLVGDNIPESQVAKIHNIIMALEKDTMQLGIAIAEDPERDTKDVLDELTAPPKNDEEI